MAAGRTAVYFAPPSCTTAAADVAEWSSGLSITITVATTLDDAAAAVKARVADGTLVAVIAKAGTSQQEGLGAPWLGALVQWHPGVFTILYSHTISLNAVQRLKVVDDHGVHMVSHRGSEVRTALERAAMVHTPAAPAPKGTQLYACPVCHRDGLTQHALWLHMPMFHVNVKKTAPAKCPICDSHERAIVVHVHDEHAPPGHPADTSRSGIALYAFGLVVVRRKKDGKFLVVQEYCNQGYWLPGGGIDAGEAPTRAAWREAVEEVGVKVKLTGVLRVEVSPHARMCRIRYIFYGEPEDDDAEPKTLPDFESAGACWVSAEEVRSGALRLRGEEPLEWFNYVERGGKIHDINLLAHEGAPPPPV